MSNASFGWINFFENASFKGITSFRNASFKGVTSFDRAQFRSNADYRFISGLGILEFNNTTWERRIDLRGMSLKELQWDSTNNPSNVKGVVDFREARIGSAMIKEVHFQGLVDISRTTFGQHREKIYGPPTREQWEKQQPDWIESDNTVYAWVNVVQEKPIVRLENNIFENEADFLHVKFNAPTVFINNRFRNTLDLTGTTFEAQTSQVQNFHLCLSFNRINRLVFEPEHLGNPPGISPYQQFGNLFTNPLHTSRIRRVDAPECMLSVQTADNPNNTTQDEEPLDDIYRTLEKSFRESNDRQGINESWYLQTLAERAHEPRFLAGFSWLLGDIPSRYTVDVWRTVWISVFIMIVFYPFYALEFWRIDRANKRNQRVPRLAIQTTGYARRPRAFRFRIFESFLATNNNASRRIIPWWDGAMLTIRSFLKLGLGTTYPKSKTLRVLTGLEWALGVFMLIHFILAVKNNLPFILPFLGAVN